jgi:hypothetical protein
MSKEINLAESTALAEAKIIALSAEPPHEIWEGRWLRSFDLPNLFVVADRKASTTALAILIVELLAIYRAQKATHSAQQALAGISLRDLPPSGLMQ